MEISFSQSESLTCHLCGTDFEAAIWLIVNTVEHSDLLEGIRRGTLHDLVCPNCNQIATQVDAPLLLYRPDETLPLLFSPAEKTTTEQDYEQLTTLLAVLRKRLGDSWKDDLLKHGLLSVARSQLSEILSSDSRPITNQMKQAAQQGADTGPNIPPEFLDDVRQATAAKSRYQSTGHIASLEEAAIAWKRILNHPAFTQKPEAFQLTVLNNTASTFMNCYLAMDKIEDLDQAILFFTEVVQRTPADSPFLSSRLNNLGGSLSTRYKLKGRLEDLEQGIDLLRRAIRLSPDDSPIFAGILNNLDTCLFARYQQLGQLADLESSINVLQTAVRLTKSDSPDLREHLYYLGCRLNIRYEQVGQVEDSEQAIDTLQNAVQLTRDDSSDLPRYLEQLSYALMNHYRSKGRSEDLDLAIDNLQKAVQLSPNDSSDQASRFNDLAAYLITRYDLTGEIKDLEDALGLLQRAGQLSSENSTDLFAVLNTLGDGLRTRYKRTGQLEDLKQAVETLQKAVNLTPNDPLLMRRSFSNLGNALQDHYERTGRLEDLERTITLFRKGVDLAPDSSPDLPDLLNNLGDALRLHYEHTGQLEDLQQAITAIQRAARLAPVISSSTLPYLTNLGTALLARYDLTEQREDLDLVIDTFGKVIQQTTSIDSPYLSSRLTNLGNCLLRRFKLTGKQEDIVEAFSVFEMAVDRARADPGSLAQYLANFGNAFLTFYRRVGAIDVLEEAIEKFQKAREHVTEDSPNFPVIINSLGVCLEYRYAHTHQLDDLHKAREAYEQACQRGMQIRLETALMSARNWGRWATERADWKEATQAYIYGVRALERLYLIQLLRTNQEEWLSQARDLHTYAAYAFAQDGHLQEAVVTLEQGRARIVSESLARNRADLEQVRVKNQEAYDDYQHAAERLRQLEKAEREGIFLDTKNHTEAISIDQIRSARSDLEQAIIRMRQLPGYEDFLAVMSYENIAQTALPGMPLVYLATTNVGSFALIVQRTTDVPEVIWAPTLTEKDIDGLLIKRINDIIVGGYLPGQLSNSQWLSEALTAALPSLGTHLMDPVAHRLREVGSTGLVLVPMGKLGILPLHAALYKKNGKEICLLDEFTVAYAPSVKVLRAVQREFLARPNALQHFVGVGNPLPGIDVGTWAKSEMQRIVPILEQTIHSLTEKSEEHTLRLTAEKRDPPQDIFRRWKKKLQYLRILSQQSAEEVIRAGVSFQQSAAFFTSVPDLPDDVAITLLHLATRIPPNLTYAQAELESIQTLLSADTVACFYEQEATRDAVWNALQQATIVHFACHGSFNAMAPLDSALQLADGVRLTLRDLLNAESQHLAHLRLAVLSACQTATTDSQRIPDEAVGLLTGFLRAGVPSVIGTLWSVNDTSTALLLTHFYDLYLGGNEQAGLLPLSPAHALSLAQRWLRDLTNNDLFTYLNEKGMAESEYLSPALLNEMLPTIRQSIRKGRGDDHPYADPRHWAAFVYYGVL